MRKFAAFVLLAWIAGSGHSLLSAGGKSDPDYYPLKPGTKWEYQLTVQGKTLKASNVIDKIEMVNGQPRAAMNVFINNQLAESEQLSSDRRGVFRHKTKMAEVKPPIMLVKYPVKTGETWESEHQSGAEKFKTVTKVGDFQEVQVPAGKYKALPVTLTVHVQGQKVDTTYWFAPDVGIVKQTANLGGLNILMELEKFTAGK